MTIGTKVTALKNLLGKTYSSWISTLADSDYADAYAWGMREIAKKARIVQKTIWIPLVTEQRYYAVYPLLYSKDRLEYVRPLDLNFLGWADDGTVITGTLDKCNFETIEQNQIIDLFYWASKFIAKGIAFKGSSFLDTDITGNLDVIATSTSGTTLKTTTNNLVAGQYVINLEKVGNSDPSYVTVVTGGTLTGVVSESVTALGWVVTDKIFIASALPSFLVFEYWALPTLDYFNTTGGAYNSAEEIPVMEQFIDDVDDLAILKLSQLLGFRDPDKIRTYSALVGSGLVRSKAEVIRDCKMRTNTIEPVVTQAYDPIGEGNLDYER